MHKILVRFTNTILNYKDYNNYCQFLLLSSGDVRYYTIPDIEATLPWYNTSWCDKNRNGGGLACYIRKYLNFIKRALSRKKIGKIIFDIRLPKSKSINIGVSYRPPNQANFIESIWKGFSHLNWTDNEIYLLGNFNINLWQNGDCVLNGKGITACQGPAHSLINKYQEFCKIFFKAINNLPYTWNMQHLFYNWSRSFKF